MGTIEQRTQDDEMENAINNLEGANMLHQDMAAYAARFHLSPAQAVALPAIFGKVAEVAGKSVRWCVAEATYHNPKLGDYVAEIAAKVTEDAA